MTHRTPTLRARLLATALALVLVPTLVTGGATLVYGVRQRREQETRSNEGLARALAGEVRQFLEAQRWHVLDSALDASLARERGPEAIRGALAVHLYSDPVLQQLLLLERDGRVTQAMPHDQDAVGLDLSREPYVRGALAGDAAASGVTESLRTGETVVALAVTAEEYVAVGFLDPRALEEFLGPSRLERGLLAAVVDQEGAILAASDPRLSREHVVLTTPLVRSGGGARSGTYRFQGKELLGSVRPVEGSGWSILVSEPLEQATAPVRRLQLWIALVVGAMAALGAAASVLVARRVVRPVEALSRAVRSLEEGAYQSPLALVAPGYREVDELARAFEAMAAAVRSREEALARSERSYRTLVDSSLVGVGRFTPEGTLVFCNEALARFFGANAPDEVVGSSCLELYRDPAQHGVLLAEIEKKGTVTNFEIQAGGRGGGERTLLLNVTREGALLSAVAVDISELRQAAADRERLEHQLLHAQKMEAVGRLAGGVAHDFNNLLTAIVGFAGILKEELGEDDPRCEAVNGILQSAHRASNLTRSLLAYSRKQVMQPRPVDLCDVIRTVDKLLRRIIGEDVELVLELPRHLWVVADPGQIEQVLVNLCTNARDAMPGGGRLHFCGDEIELDEAAAGGRELSAAGRFARVRVKDSGRGMSREVMARVFEPFYSTKSPTSGTGLGLSIVYGIMRQHGGSVELESELGRGTTVTLLLPLHQGEVTVGEAVPPVHKAPRGKETLLLAEDEPLVRNAMQTALRRAGYEVVSATDGEEAVVQFTVHQDRVALCVLDVVMPRKNGREAADAITALRPGVPILLASGYAADVLEERGHGGAGLEVIAKPFTPEELLRRVRERLDRGW